MQSQSQPQFQEIKDILASCQDQLNTLLMNTSKTTLTAEEKEKYFQLDVVIRIVGKKKGKDLINVLRQNAWVPKDIFDDSLRSTNYQVMSREDLLIHLEQKCVTPLEKKLLAECSDATLRNLHSELPLSKTIDVEKLQEFMTSLVLENKEIEDVKIYRIIEIVVIEYTNEERIGLVYNMNENILLYNKLKSLEDRKHRVKLSIRMR